MTAVWTAWAGRDYAFPHTKPSPFPRSGFNVPGLALWASPYNAGMTSRQLTKTALREAIAMEDAKIESYSLILTAKKPSGERREEILQGMIQSRERRKILIEALGKLE